MANSWLRGLVRYAFGVDSSPATGGSRRLQLEVLEDRAVPAGVVTGTAFIDRNANGAFDAGEVALGGAVVQVSGATTRGTPFSLSVTTNASGGFQINNVLPGTYQFTAPSVPGLIGAGQLSDPAAPGRAPLATLTLGEDQNAGLLVGFGGVAPESISLRQFLATAPASSSYSPQPAGSGVGAVTVPVGLPGFTASAPPVVAFNTAAQAQSVANFATYARGENAPNRSVYSVSAVSNPGMFLVPPAVAANGTLTYTPKAGGFGSSTFSLTVSDGVNTSAPQTFTIKVDPVQGLENTTLPGTTIALNDPNWAVIPTLVAAGNSAGIPAGTVADGTRVLDTVVGTGATVARGNQVNVTYRGYLLSGTSFDNGTTTFTASETALIPGFAAGLIGMKVGGTRLIDIPSYLAYGSGTNPGGQANARLVFELTVNSIV